MNFTSDVHHFSPYTPQSPVEAEALVGSQKQGELQAGIQKVQGYVDYLHGFDIAKDVTRDYIQGKIGSMKEQVGNVAGDFSDNRLVNQVGGLAGKIASDPIVQNGILSTATYRKGVQDLEASKKPDKDGKTSYAPQNEWDFMTKAQDWLNDGDHTTSFSAGYTPHTDYMKMFTDAYKEIHPSSNLTQDLIDKKDGAGIIQVLNEVDKEGIDANEVNKLWNTISSNPAVQQQLSIDGRYQYRGMGPQDVYNHLTDSYRANVDDINNKIKDIQERAAVDRKVNPKEVASAINALKQQGSYYAEQYKGIVSLIPGVGNNSNIQGLDDAKAAIFSTNMASSLASTYSWSKQTDKIVDSPLWKAHMDQIKYELETAKFGEEIRHNKATEDISLMNALKVGKGNTKTSGEGSTADGSDFTTREDVVDSKAGEKGSATYYQTTKDLEGQLGQAMYKALFKIAIAGGIDNPIVKTPSGFQYNPDYPGGIPEAINAGRRLWTASRQSMIGGTAKPSVQEEFGNVDPLIREVNSRREVAKLKEAKYEPELQKIASQYGKPIDRKMFDYWVVNNNAPGKEDAQKRLDSLPNKEQDELYNSVHSVTKTPYGDVTYKSGEYRDLDNFLKKNASILPTLQKREEDFKSSQTAFNPTVSTIETPKAEDMARWRQRFASIAQTYNLNDNAKDFLKELSVASTKEKAGETGNIYQTVFDKNDNKSYLRILRAGKDPVDLEVQESDIKSLGFDTRDEFWDKFGPELQLTNNTSTQVRKSGPDDNGLASAHILQQPKGSQYQVKYHLYSDGEGLYGMRLFIQDKDGNMKGENVTLGNTVSKSAIMDRVKNGFKDEEIQGILLNNR